MGFGIYPTSQNFSVSLEIWRGLRPRIRIIARKDPLVLLSPQRTGSRYPTGGYGHVSMILSAKIGQNPRYHLVSIILPLNLETTANFVLRIGQLFITSFTNIRRFCGCGRGQSANRPASYHFFRTNRWIHNNYKTLPD